MVTVDSQIPVLVMVGFPFAVRQHEVDPYGSITNIQKNYLIDPSSLIQTKVVLIRISDLSSSLHWSGLDLINRFGYRVKPPPPINVLSSQRDMTN